MIFCGEAEKSRTLQSVMINGFDNDKYLRIQSEHIKERIAQFGNKLYLELGGKLFDDNHASRVLPGFQPDSKLRMLSQLQDQAEIVIVISALDIEKNKVRQDLGITYDMDVLRLREAFIPDVEVLGGVPRHVRADERAFSKARIPFFAQESTTCIQSIRRDISEEVGRDRKSTRLNSSHLA